MTELPSLEDIFQHQIQRSSFKFPHYFPIYEKYFSALRNKPITLLEIGVANGGSMQLWKKYFGTNAKIVGIDIKQNSFFDEEQIHIRIGDQTDIEFLESIASEFGPFDIIVDDGSHIQTHIQTTFDALIGHVKPGGFYLVEDLHVAYSKKYGGELYGDDSFIENSKDVVDDIHWMYTQGSIEQLEISEHIFGVYFHNGIIVYEIAKKPFPAKSIYAENREKGLRTFLVTLENIQIENF